VSLGHELCAKLGKHFGDTVNTARGLHQDNKVLGRGRWTLSNFQACSRELQRRARTLAVKDSRVWAKTGAVSGRERLSEALSPKNTQNVIWYSLTG